MDKELVKGNIGSVGNYDLEFKGGKLLGTVSVSHEATDGVGVSANLTLALDANKVIDAIEAAIPGDLDKIPLELLRKLLASA